MSNLRQNTFKIYGLRLKIYLNVRNVTRNLSSFIMNSVDDSYFFYQFLMNIHKLYKIVFVDLCSHLVPSHTLLSFFLQTRASLTVISHLTTWNILNQHIYIYIFVNVGRIIVRVQTEHTSRCTCRREHL